MAETKEDQQARYPLPAYNFRVTIDGTAMSFSEVSGISMEYDTVTYRHGLSFWEGEGIQKYYFGKSVPITMKKGTIKGINFLYDWIQQKDQAPRTMEVSLCDETGQPVVSWRVGKVIPVKLQAPTFDASTNEAAVESLEVLGRNISVEHH